MSPGPLLTASELLEEMCFSSQYTPPTHMSEESSQDPRNLELKTRITFEQQSMFINK